jgi:hypothetical protein
MTIRADISDQPVLYEHILQVATVVSGDPAKAAQWCEELFYVESS